MSPGFIAYLSVCLGIITIAIVAVCAVCIMVMLRVRHLAGEVEKVVGAVRAAVRPLAVLAGVAAGVSSWVGRFQKANREEGMSEERGQMTGLVIGLALGTVIGAVLGVLFAPAPGSETREKLRQAAEELPGRRRKSPRKVRDTFRRKENQEEEPIL